MATCSLILMTYGHTVTSFTVIHKSAHILRLLSYFGHDLNEEPHIVKFVTLFYSQF